MDTQNLRTFLVLSELKNFTQTADQLFVAQSTVTNRISELERELGKKLFNRDKRSVELTNEGAIFRSYAKRIITLEESSIQEINSQNLFKNNLRIGTTNTIYECYLYNRIHDYMNRNLDCAVKVTIGHSISLLQALQDGLLDLVYSYVPMNKNGFSCETFATDRLVLVTSPGNNIYKKGIKKEALSNINYLFCNFALQEVGYFIKELFPPFYQFRFEIDNSTKLVQYLIDGNGFSFLPESLVNANIASKELEIIPLIDFDTPMINCYRVYRNDGNAATLI
ncbi:MAG TPA: LysR family transcriptional regulator [Mobilitalea sp.]|nr:LysR family transcriptional regulator [Mobilitalea sp.]